MGFAFIDPDFFGYFFVPSKKERLTNNNPQIKARNTSRGTILKHRRKRWLTF